MRRARKSRTSSDDVVVVRVELHGCGVPAMCIRTTACAALGHDPHQLRVAREPDIVDDRAPAAQRSAGDLGLGRVDGDRAR